MIGILKTKTKVRTAANTTLRPTAICSKLYDDTESGSSNIKYLPISVVDSFSSFWVSIQPLNVRNPINIIVKLASTRKDCRAFVVNKIPHAIAEQIIT